MLKKILKITGITLLVLIVILFTAPFIFKGKILKIAKEQINKNINAKADFKDVSVSFFRRFPRVSAGTGRTAGDRHSDEFSKDTLISAKEIDVAVNLFSVFSAKDMKVYAINIDEPRIHATGHQRRQGQLGYRQTRYRYAPPRPKKPASPFKLNLQKYAIKNGYVYYDDASAGMSSEIVNLNHEGSGDFTSDLFTLQTNTTADAITFSYGGIPYLSKTKTSIDADYRRSITRTASIVSRPMRSPSTT